jgi:tetratricopeptide (TPR) repeat protein
MDEGTRRQRQFQEQMIQAKNRYRAGVDFYERGDYAKARGQFEQTIQMAPDSTEAENAKKYLENVRVALGEADEKAGAERGARAAAKAVQRAQQMTNLALRERQEALLAQAQQAARTGRTGEAEAAYQVAVQMGEELKLRGEEAREQAAVLREAEGFLGKKQAERGRQQARVAELEERLAQAKEELARTGGKEAAELAEALVEGDERGVVSSESYWVSREPTAPAQVEVGRAIAEQQVTGPQTTCGLRPAYHRSTRMRRAESASAAERTGQSP